MDDEDFPAPLRFEGIADEAPLNDICLIYSNSIMQPDDGLNFVTTRRFRRMADEAADVCARGLPTAQPLPCRLPLSKMVRQSLCGAFLRL